jgi:hypothetical protein
MPELPELDRVLHSGELAYGEYTKRFESKLKNISEPTTYRHQLFQQRDIVVISVLVRVSATKL